MHWYDLTELLPTIYRRLKSMYATARTEDIQLRSFLLSADRIRNNFFVQTCDVATLEYYEALLNLEVTEYQSINDRRRAILVAMNNQQPFTLPYLKEQLNVIFGVGNWKIEVRNIESSGTPDHVGTALFIEVNSAFKPSIDTLASLLVRIIPAHVLPRVSDRFGDETGVLNPNIGCLLGVTSNAVCKIGG